MEDVYAGMPAFVVEVQRKNIRCKIVQLSYTTSPRSQVTQSHSVNENRNMGVNGKKILYAIFALIRYRQKSLVREYSTRAMYSSLLRRGLWSSVRHDFISVLGS